jgi:hypothetical protein
MAPQITHVSVPVLIQLAALYCAKVGEAGTAPALTTVVVPEVTALIVQVPAPRFKTVITVPVAKATEALVGILKALAEALFMVTST